MGQKNKKPFNWRSRYEITAEVQADLRKKGITINSKLTLGTKINSLVGVSHNGKTRFRSVL